MPGGPETIDTGGTERLGGRRRMRSRDWGPAAQATERDGKGR